MDSVIQINDQYAFAFGLTWQALDPMMSRGSQLKEIRNGHGAKWLATFKVQGQENIGYARDLVLPLKIVTLSGAGQIAISDACKGKTALVMLEEAGTDGEENDVAIVAILDGNVVHDVFVKIAAVGDIRAKFEEQCARANIAFVTMGRVISLPAVDEALEWSDFLPPPRGTGKARFKKTITVPVTELKADMPTWMLMTIVLFGLIAVGYWQWDSAMNEKSRLRRLSMQSAPPDPAQLYAVSAAALLAQPVILANEALPELRRQLKSFPTELAGWTLTRIDCAAEGCSAFWQRKSGTYQEFVDRAPKEWGQVQLHNDGTKIAHNVPVKLAKTTLEAREKWPLEREFILTVVSKWQRFNDVKLGVDLSPSALLAVPPAMRPDVAAALPTAVWAAKWNVKDSQWWMSEGLYSLPSNVTIENVSLLFGPEINFNAQGKVYVRK